MKITVLPSFAFCGLSLNVALLLLSTLASISAAAVPAKNAMQLAMPKESLKPICNKSFLAAGLTQRFPGVVAHGVHSLTVEDLRAFEKDVTVKNSIPTVNLLLDADPAILPNAPSRSSNVSFRTPGLQAADLVLSHMEEKMYDVKLYSPLERLVHALHMKEVWNDALPHYQKLKSDPPTNADLCPCVKDIDANGIMKMLRFIALAVREPELMYGAHTNINSGSGTWSGNLYNYAFFPQNLQDVTLASPEEVIPPLRTEAAWAHWKKLMMDMKPSDDYELAVFLYCTLNQ